MGVEPTNGGFADLSLGPLGYRAELLSIAKLAQTPALLLATKIAGVRSLSPNKHFAGQGLEQRCNTGKTVPANFSFTISCYLFFVHQGRIDFCFTQETR